MGKGEMEVLNGEERVIRRTQKGTQKPHNQSVFLTHPWLLYHIKVHLKGTAWQASDLTSPCDMSTFFFFFPKTNRGEFWGEHCLFLRTFPNRQTSSALVITVYHNIFFLKQLVISAKSSALRSLWKCSWESLSLFLLFHFWERLCSVLISTAVN